MGDYVIIHHKKVEIVHMIKKLQILQSVDLEAKYEIIITQNRVKYDENIKLLAEKATKKIESVQNETIKLKDDLQDKCDYITNLESQVKHRQIEVRQYKMECEHNKKQIESMEQLRQSYDHDRSKLRSEIEDHKRQITT